MGFLIEDVKLFSGSFSKLLYSYIRRDGNKLAHSLARYAVKVCSFLVWMKFVPPIFNIVFQADLADIS